MKYLALLLMTFSILNSHAGTTAIECEIEYSPGEKQVFHVANQQCVDVSELFLPAKVSYRERLDKKVHLKEAECNNLPLFRIGQKRTCQKELDKLFIDNEDKKESMQSSTFALCATERRSWRTTESDEIKVFIRRTERGPNYIINDILERYSLISEMNNKEIGIMISGDKQNPPYEHNELPMPVKTEDADVILKCKKVD